MTPSEIDQTLVRLSDRKTAISSKLIALEHDPYWSLFEAASLTGDSAARRAEGKKCISELWEWLRRFDEGTRQASDVRGTKRRLSTDESERIEQLLADVSNDIGNAAALLDSAAGVVSAVTEAWDALLPRLRSTEEQFAQLSQRAEAVGEDAVLKTPKLQAALERQRESLTTDPLSVAGDDLDPIDVMLAELKREIESAERLKTEAAGEFQRARTILAALRGSEQAAAAAHQECTLKIASPAIPPAVAIDGALVQQFGRAEALSQEGNWLVAQRELHDWMARASELAKRLDENLAANRRPLEERNQLRGRLDAYRSKVHRLGMIEDPSLSALYNAARDALFTAPTDLDAAGDLVERYQRAVPAEPPRKAPM